MSFSLNGINRGGVILLLHRLREEGVIPISWSIRGEWGRSSGEAATSISSTPDREKYRSNS